MSNFRPNGSPTLQKQGKERKLSIHKTAEDHRFGRRHYPDVGAGQGPEN